MSNTLIIRALTMTDDAGTEYTISSCIEEDSHIVGITSPNMPDLVLSFSEQALNELIAGIIATAKLDTDKLIAMIIEALNAVITVRATEASMGDIQLSMFGFDPTNN